MSQYNPKKIRRCVRRAVVTETKIVCKTKSFTQESNKDAYTPTIDFAAKTVFCQCENFKREHAHHNPTPATTAHHCKHLKRAIANATRNGEFAIEQSQSAPNPERDAALAALVAQMGF